MDLQSLANLGEFIGGAAVLVTLGYLALQIRQNTQSIRTENYARALERVSAMQARKIRSIHAESLERTGGGAGRSEARSLSAKASDHRWIARNAARASARQCRR